MYCAKCALEQLILIIPWDLLATSRTRALSFSLTLSFLLSPLSLTLPLHALFSYLHTLLSSPVIINERENQKVKKALNTWLESKDT